MSGPEALLNRVKELQKQAMAAAQTSVSTRQAAPVQVTPPLGGGEPQQEADEQPDVRVLQRMAFQAPPSPLMTPAQGAPPSPINQSFGGDVPVAPPEFKFEPKKPDAVSFQTAYELIAGEITKRYPDLDLRTEVGSQFVATNAMLYLNMIDFNNQLNEQVPTAAKDLTDRYQASQVQLQDATIQGTRFTPQGWDTMGGLAAAANPTSPLDPMAALFAYNDEVYKEHKGDDFLYQMQTMEQTEAANTQIFEKYFLQIPAAPLPGTLDKAAQKINRAANWVQDLPVVGGFLGAVGGNIATEGRAVWWALGKPQEGWNKLAEMIPEDAPMATNIKGLMGDVGELALAPEMLILMPFMGGGSVIKAAKVMAGMTASGVAGDVAVRTFNDIYDTNIPPAVGLWGMSILGPTGAGIVSKLRATPDDIIRMGGDNVIIVHFGTTGDGARAVRSSRAIIAEAATEGSFRGTTFSIQKAEAARAAGAAETVSATAGKVEGKGIITASVSVNKKIATVAEQDQARALLGIGTDTSPAAMEKLTAALEQAGFEGAWIGEQTMRIFDATKSATLHTMVDVTEGAKPFVRIRGLTAGSRSSARGAPAEGAGPFTVNAKTKKASQTVGDFTVWSRQRNNGTIEIGFSGGEKGTAESFVEVRDEIGRLLQRAVADNPGKTVIIESFDPKKAGPLKALLKKAGLAVDDDGVVTIVAGAKGKAVVSPDAILDEAALKRALGENGYAIVSATTTQNLATKAGWDEAVRLNEEFAARLQSMGFDATAQKGYRGPPGAAKAEPVPTVFIANMSADDAYKFGRLNNQSSVFTSEGEIITSGADAGMIKRIVPNSTKIGPNLDTSAGSTEFTLGNGKTTRVSLETEEELTPWAGKLMTEYKATMPIGPNDIELFSLEKNGQLAIDRSAWQARVFNWSVKFLPGLEKFMIPFSPYATGKRALSKAVLGYNISIEAAAAKSQYMMNILLNQGKMGRLRSAESQLTIAVRSDVPVARKADAEARAIGDIMQHGQDWYVLTNDEETFRRMAHDVLETALKDMRAGGVTVEEITYKSMLEMWFPRKNIGQFGAEKVGASVKGAGGPKQMADFMRRRFLETQGQFVRDAGIIETDVMGIIQSTIRTMYKLSIDKQLMTYMKKLGVPIEKLVPAELEVNAKGYKALVKQTLSFRNNLKAQIGIPGFKKPFRRPKPLNIGGFDNTWLGEANDEVRAIVAKYTKMSKAGTVGKDEMKLMAAELQPYIDRAETSLTNLRGLATQARNDIKVLKDKLRNTMATYQKVPTGGEVDNKMFMKGVQDMSGLGPPTAPSKPFIDAMRKAGLDTFPENGFAIRRLSSVKFPDLTDILFPADIANSLEKVYDVGANAVLLKMQKLVDAGRALETGFDLNFPFIQGIYMLGRNPEGWRRAVELSYATVGNPKIAQGYFLAQKQLHPEAFNGFVNNVRQIKESEFFLAARGEGYLSKIPGLRSAAGRMGESFETFLDVAKWEWYKAMYPTVSAKYGERGLAELGAIIKNALGTTSTASLGVPGAQRSAETLLLFAPRYTRSIFALMSDAVSGGIRGSEARKALGSMLATVSLVYIAVANAAGQKPDFNPLSSGFMSLRVGDNYIGIPGVTRSVMGTMARSLDAAINDPGVFYNPHRFLEDPVVRFFRSRQATGISDMMDILVGKDYIGRPTRSEWQDVARLMQGFVSPFSVGAYQEVNGDMADHFTITVGSFLLGRTAPISPTQLRNERVYAWAKAAGITVTDLNGQKITPTTYTILPAYLKEEFDKILPESTQKVEAWRAANNNALVEVDAARNDAQSKIFQAGLDLVNPANEKAYGDYQLYQQRVSDILGTQAGIISAYYDKHQFDQKTVTMEQKYILKYNDEVLMASKDMFENIDWNLQNALERQFFQKNPDAREVIYRQYTSSLDQVDSERRIINWFLQDTYYAYMDSLWSREGMTAFEDPASKWTDSPLLTLSNGRRPLDFGSVLEYQRALDYELYSTFEQTGIDESLAGIKTGGKDSETYGALYGHGVPLRGALLQEAVVTYRKSVMKDWWAFNDAFSIDYLSEPDHLEILEDLRIWKKSDLPAALEEALAGYVTPAPAQMAPTTGSRKYDPVQ